MNIFRRFSLKKAILGLSLAIGLVFAGNVVVQNSALASLPRDCDPNSIINCGVQNTTELQQKYNSTPELRTLYAHPFNGSVAGYGLQNSDIDRIASKGKQGLAYRDGRIVIDGQVVATNAQSLGRNKNGKAERLPITIGSTTYYHGPTGISYAAGVESIPVFVLFNDNGEVEFAVLNACGNPIWGDNVKPAYECKKLHKTPVEGKMNTYKFTTETFANNNANVVKVIYDFGDGTTVEKTNKDASFEHEYTYTKPGAYTAKVSIVVSLPGNNTKTVTSEWCKTQIKVEEPVYKCESLTGKLISGNRKYRFELKATAKNGATLKSASFDFGDGQKAENIKPPLETGAITMSIDHQYANELFGKKTITAKLTFNIGQETKVKECTTDIDLKKETCADKPNAPECQPPVEYCKPGIPKGDDRCKEILPKEIVKTGPTELVASAFGLGGLAGAGMYYRASRRNLIDTLLKRK